MKKIRTGQLKGGTGDFYEGQNAARIVAAAKPSASGGCSESGTAESRLRAEIALQK